MQKEQKKPGLYETYANLGTFYIHSGAYEKGLEYIDKAIAINPNAHFGREVYQKYLVEYVMMHQKDGKIELPFLRNDLSFDRFLQQKQGIEFDIQEAITGILGIMKFGNYKSPILLEALAHLLLKGREKDGKQLARRAFLKASYETKEEEPKQMYYKLAQSQIKAHIEYSENWEKFEREFQEELAEAETYRHQLATDEVRWIKENKDVEKEFAQRYYNDPKFDSHVNYFKLQLTILLGVLCCYHFLIRLPAKAKFFHDIQAILGAKNEKHIFQIVIFIVGFLLFGSIFSGLIKGFSFTEIFWYY